MESHADDLRPNGPKARRALSSVRDAQRRLAAVPQPGWLHPALGTCMLLGAASFALPKVARDVAQGVILVAILVLCSVAQRCRGVVARATLSTAGLTARSVLGAVAVTVGVAAGLGPVVFCALALFIVVGDPRLQAARRSRG